MWALWDLEGLVDRVDAADGPWWAFWRDDDSAGAWAVLKVADDSIQVVKGTRPLFRVNLRSHAAVQIVRVDTPEPLGGVLVRITVSDYRSAEVVELGYLAKRDEAWEALPAEDRRDVLYLTPALADAALAAVRAAVASGPS